MFSFVTVIYVLFGVFCVPFVCKCELLLLPTGVNPITVKYIYQYHVVSMSASLAKNFPDISVVTDYPEANTRR
jgi:hypothetical protein